MSVLKMLDARIYEMNKEVAWAYYARAFVLEHLAMFDLLPDATLAGNIIDFDNLKHEQVMEVVKAFPGRWKKEPNGATIHYSITLRNTSKTAELCEIVLRCYAGEPPPNCQIVYEDIHVPAQTVRKAKLVCIDRPALNGEHIPVEIADEIIDAEVCSSCE